jgi:hypothetical protein
MAIGGGLTTLKGQSEKKKIAFGFWGWLAIPTIFF